MSNQSYNTLILIQSSFQPLLNLSGALSWQIRVIAQSKLTDYTCTAKVEHIILFENGSINSINLKTILLNAQPSGARAENSAKSIQVLLTAAPPLLSG